MPRSIPSTPEIISFLRFSAIFRVPAGFRSVPDGTRSYHGAFRRNSSVGRRQFWPSFSNTAHNFVNAARSRSNPALSRSDA